MKICDFLAQDRILTTLVTRSKEEVIAALATLVAQSHPAIDRLTLHMNKVRQAAITKEIIEVVSGAGAPG